MKMTDKICYDLVITRGKIRELKVAIPPVKPFFERRFNAFSMPISGQLRLHRPLKTDISLSSIGSAYFPTSRAALKNSFQPSELAFFQKLLYTQNGWVRAETERRPSKLNREVKKNPDKCRCSCCRSWWASAVLRLVSHKLAARPDCKHAPKRHRLVFDDRHCGFCRRDFHLFGKR